MRRASWFWVGSLLACGGQTVIDDGVIDGPAERGGATPDTRVETTSTDPFPTTTEPAGDGGAAGASGPECEDPEGGIVFWDCTEDVCSEQVCGTLESPFDDRGCPRPACNDDDGCGLGERCYAAQDFGGCTSSGTVCSPDRQGGCICSGLADCGGAYCVPAGLLD